MLSWHGSVALEVVVSVVDDAYGVDRNAYNV